MQLIALFLKRKNYLQTFICRVMSIEILMPALSPTMTEGNLSKWLVKEGDKVSSGDVIAEIETDKATMEIESADEGTVTKLLIKEGTESVPVNSPIAVLDGEDNEKDDIKNTDDYITTDGGFFINPGIGIKRSFRKKHFSFNIGYMIQNYKSEHNFWRWDWWPIIGLPDDQSNNIIRREGNFKVLTFSFSIYF